MAIITSCAWKFFQGTPLTAQATSCAVMTLARPAPRLTPVPALLALERVSWSAPLAPAALIQTLPHALEASIGLTAVWPDSHQSMAPALPVQKTASLVQYEELVTVTMGAAGMDTWSSLAPPTALNVLQAVPRAPVVVRVYAPPVWMGCICQTQVSVLPVLQIARSAPLRPFVLFVSVDLFCSPTPATKNCHFPAQCRPKAPALPAMSAITLSMVSATSTLPVTQTPAVSAVELGSISTQEGVSTARLGPTASIARPQLLRSVSSAWSGTILLVPLVTLVPQPWPAVKGVFRAVSAHGPTVATICNGSTENIMAEHLPAKVPVKHVLASQPA